MIEGIEPLETVAAVEDPAFVFFGPPGGGKTTAAAQLLCPIAIKRKKRVLWLDVDRKLAQQLNIPPEHRAVIDIWKPSEPLAGTEIGVPRIPQFEGSGSARKQVAGTAGYIPKEPKGYLELVGIINKVLADPSAKDRYAGVCLDTATTVEEHAQRLVCNHHKRGTFTTELWGVYGSLWTEFRAGFLSLPGIRIMCVHSQERGEEGETKRVIPAIQGYTGDRLAKDYNEVYYFEGRETGQNGKYMIRVASNPKFTSPRTSLVGIPDRISVDDMLAKHLARLS